MKRGDVLRLSWVPPQRLEMKFNTYDNHNPVAGKMGAGSVIRNTIGRWIHGFYSAVQGEGCAMFAEIVALKQGLELL